MKNKVFISTWEITWKWIFRALFLFISIIAAYHIPDNPVGMIFLSVLFLLFACYIKYDVIYLFDNRIELHKKYLFNLLQIKTAYKFSDIVNVLEQFDENDETLEFFIGYGVKRSFYLRLKDGRNIEIRTYIPVYKIKVIKKIIMQKIVH